MTDEPRTAPRYNMTMEQLKPYHDAMVFIQNIRRDNGLRGVVADNDALMREQLAVCRVIIHYGIQVYSEEDQQILESHIELWQRLENRQREFERR